MAAPDVEERTSLQEETVISADARAYPRADSAVFSEESYDVIVIGAGILGAALAFALGRQGRRVLVIERDWREPDRIVGELLQPGGVNALRRLGLEDCLDGIDAVPVHGYAVFNGAKHVKLPYPAAQDGSRNIGKSFHHGKFIMSLRSAVKKVKSVTCLEATANTLIRDDDGRRVVGVTCTVKGSGGSVVKSFYASLTVTADGCFSKFRKQFVSHDVTVRSHFAGIVLKHCPLPFPNHGHVVLAKPSPILLYQIGTDDTRILVDIPGKIPSSSNGDFENYMLEFVCPQLPEAVRESFREGVKRDRIRSMPNQWLPPSTNITPGVVVLGDAMNMRHPLTGGGMTVAFWDVVHFVDLIKPIQNLGDDKRVLTALQSLHWRRKNLSSVINILAQALYDLFAAGDDTNLNYLQRACFNYFELGGRCVSTPVGLLAGLIPSPLTLVGHFYAVAVVGMWTVIRDYPVYLLPIALIRGILVLATATRVIGPVVWSELKA